MTSWEHGFDPQVGSLLKSWQQSRIKFFRILGRSLHLSLVQDWVQTMARFLATTLPSAWRALLATTLPPHCLPCGARRAYDMVTTLCQV